MTTRKFPELYMGLVILSLVIGGCKDKTDPLNSKKSLAADFKKKVAIRSSIRKKAYDEKDNLPPDTRKLSSEIRELILQFQESHNSAQVSDSIIDAEGSSLSTSPAIFDSSRSKVLVYLSINKTPDSLSHLKTKLARLGIDFPPIDTGLTQFVVLVPIDKLDTITHFPEISYIRFVNPPARMTDSDDRNLGRAEIQSNTAEFIWGKDAIGTGVKVGVISDDCGSSGDHTLQGSLTNNYLSAAPTILNAVALTHQTTNTHEGLGMLEIVHKNAPGSQLYFASAGNSSTDMCNSIRALAGSGCKVITEDMFFYDDPFFEDGDIARTINSVVSNYNVTYIPAAGNTAHKVFSFTIDPQEVMLLGQTRFVHHADGHTCPRTLTLRPLQWATIVLQWDDQFDRAMNDYDVVLINTTNSNDVVFLDNPQQSIIKNNEVLVSNKPLELKTIYNSETNAKTYSINIVVKHNSENQFSKMKLMVDAGGYVQDDNRPEHSVVGHSTAEGAMCCGAVLTFQGRCVPEDFSPLGPARMRLFEDGGSAMGGHPSVDRQMPVIASADGITTTFRANFTGTSAAAPNAAGMAAQLLGILPSLQQDAVQTRNLIMQSCIPYPQFSAQMGAGKTNTFKTISTALSLQPGSTACAAFSTTPIERILTNDITEEYTSQINLSGSPSSLTQIHDGFVFLDLEFGPPFQSHILKIELRSNDGKRVVLYDDGNNPRSVPLMTVFALQNTSRTAAPDYGITIPQGVLDATTPPLQGTNPKQTWSLVITTSGSRPASFANPARIYLQNWGVYFR